MFRCLLTLTTTLAVMLHALLGCCAHHVHAGDACGHETDAVAETCEHGHRHAVAEADADAEQHDGRHHPGDDEPCCESDCHFFVTAKRCDDVGSILLTSWLPVTADSDDLARLFSLTWRSDIEHSAEHLLMPKPLRAATQVWLL